MKAKYEEIMDWIKQQLHHGELYAGNKLPSIRQLALTFNCSKNTVLKAYDELEKEHIIYAKSKSGHYIVSHVKQIPAPSETIDFLSAGPAKDLIPYTEFQHCLNKAIDTYKEELFEYGNPQGLVSLRQEIVHQLQSLQVFTTTERVVITSGSQQALHLLATLPFPNNKQTILIEQPTYFGMINAIHLSGASVMGIPVTTDGVDLQQLETIFQQQTIKFFYVIPRFHNPLGHSYTNAEKKKIVELANQYDVYIVEDDFLGALDTNNKADSIFSYDPSGRVIYIQSYSKTFLPGMRIASVVVPQCLIESFLRYKVSADFTSPILSQGALELYLKSGLYSTHLAKIQHIYAHKMAILQESCARLLPKSVLYTTPTSGFYLTLYLPKEVSAKRLTEELAKRHIIVDHCDRMFLHGHNSDKLIRLCISQLEEQQIVDGVKGISEAITRLVVRSSY
ncbi:MAG: PLP-dependent aminotransferase family protein [Solibacillus sp.]